jgi:hypothetical protein
VAELATPIFPTERDRSLSGHSLTSLDLFEAPSSADSSAAFGDDWLVRPNTVATPIPLAFAQIDRLKSLPIGWNGHGALPPSAPAMAAAKRVLQALPSYHAAVPVSVVPTNRRGIQLEWHARGLDLEIEVDTLGGVTFCVEDRDGDVEGEGELSANWLLIARALRRLA